MRKMDGPDRDVIGARDIRHVSLVELVGKFCFIAALAVPIALSGASLPVSAQDQQDQQQPQQQPLTQQELAQLVAPIALYPDALLAQVLTASTYPLEVVMAARWSEEELRSQRRGSRRCDAKRAVGSKRQGINLGPASFGNDER